MEFLLKEGSAVQSRQFVVETKVDHFFFFQFMGGNIPAGSDVPGEFPLPIPEGTAQLANPVIMSVAPLETIFGLKGALPCRGLPANLDVALPIIWVDSLQPTESLLFLPGSTGELKPVSIEVITLVFAVGTPDKQGEAVKQTRIEIPTAMAASICL